MHHGELLDLVLKLDGKQRLSDRVLALRRNLGDHATRLAGGEQDLVLPDERVLVHDTPDVAARDVVPDLQGRLEIPQLFAVEGWHGDAGRDVYAVRDNSDLVEGPLDTVEDVVEEAGAELNREGLSGTENGGANAEARYTLRLAPWLRPNRGRGEKEPTGLLKHLDAGLFPIDADDLALKLEGADFNLYHTGQNR